MIFNDPNFCRSVISLREPYIKLQDNSTVTIDTIDLMHTHREIDHQVRLKYFRLVWNYYSTPFLVHIF